MSDELLDTIDHVLHDYATSPDAMRWTPEPVRPLAVRPLVPPTLSPEFARTVTQMFDGMAKAFQRIGKAVAELAPRFMEVRRQVEAAQAAEAAVRRSAMHSAYRQRTRARKRR